MVLAFHLYLLEPWRLQGWLSTCVGLRTASSCQLFHLMVTYHLHDCVIQWNKSPGIVWKNVFEKLNIFPSFFLKKDLFHLFILLHLVLVVAYEIYFPDQGLNLGSLHQECRVLATVLPGKSLNIFLKGFKDFLQDWRESGLFTARSKCCGYLVNW